MRALHIPALTMAAGYKQGDLITTFPTNNRVLISINAEKNNLVFTLMFDKVWQPLNLCEKLYESSNV